MTNKKVNKYISLTNRIKKLEAQREALRQEFIASNGGESSKFLVTVQRVLRETVAGKMRFVEKFGENFLSENGLLNFSEVNTIFITDKQETFKEGVA